MSNKIILVKNNYKSIHVSVDVVNEFENCIINKNNNSCNVLLLRNSLFGCLFLFVLKKIRKIGINISTIISIVFSIIYRGNYFSIMMGWNLEYILPMLILTKRKNLYIFDAWPNYYDSIIECVNKYKIENVYITSKISTENLKKYKTSCNFVWIPEAINPSNYQFYDYKEKDIDVLEIGRKYDVYHDKIIKPLKQHSYNHLYEVSKGVLVFKERTDFIIGLARSKISICFPSSITHPDRSLGVETMTIRYLQSIASKCLIVGKAPKEMIELFGYNPVIEADTVDPGKQLIEILNNYGDYYGLIEKNYANIFNHSWDVRWTLILNSMLCLD